MRQFVSEVIKRNLSSYALQEWLSREYAKSPFDRINKVSGKGAHRLYEEQDICDNCGEQFGDHMARYPHTHVIREKGKKPFKCEAFVYQIVKTG